MRPIPREMREALAQQVRMGICTLHNLQDIYGFCDGRVEWHHVWQYAGKQVNEVWAILPGCKRHHRMVNEQQAVRMAFERASLALATDEDLAKYPRKDWTQIKRSLS